MRIDHIVAVVVVVRFDVLRWLPAKLTNGGLGEADAVVDVGAEVGAQGGVASVLGVAEINDWAAGGVCGRLGPCG